MYKSDVEMFYRMALGRLELASEEIARIRSNIFDTPNMGEAELGLWGAIDAFVNAQQEAAEYFGFEIRESQNT